MEIGFGMGTYWKPYKLIIPYPDCRSIMYTKVEHWKEAVPVFFERIFAKFSKNKEEAFVK